MKHGAFCNFYDKRGLTLVELLVVLTLFLVIIGVTVNIFVLTVNQQRTVLKEQEFLNQASFAAEYISKSVRAAVKDANGNCLKEGETSYPGYVYLLTNYNSEEGFYEGIKFINSNNVCQGFFIDSDGTLKEKRGSSQAQNMLSGQLQINYARFILDGDKAKNKSGEKGSVQPRVTFSLSTVIQGDSQKEKIIQTTISQRNLNLSQ